MSRKANFFKLGLFVIIAFALGAVFLIIFGAGNFFKKELLAETCFNESVQGLSIGSEVKYKGIQIGTVKSITSASRIYNTKSDYVLVIISLEDDISMGQTGKNAKQRMLNAINDGLTVRLAFKGLTGAAYLETDYTPSLPGNRLTVPWTPSNIYIPSERSNMKQFGDALNQILENLSAINLKGIILDIETLLKTLNSKIGDFDMDRVSALLASLLSELEGVSQKLGKAVDPVKIDRLMGDAQASFKGIRKLVDTAGPALTAAVDDFRQTAGSTKNITAQFEDRLSPALNSLSGNLDGLIKNLNAVSGQMENMVWLNADRIGVIIDNIETTSENLKQMSRELKEYPGRLIFQKPPKPGAVKGDTR